MAPVGWCQLREGETWDRRLVSFPRRRSRREAGIESLWSEFKQTGAQALRNQLIIYYSPFVKYVAGRVLAGLPRHFDEEDLVSYGIIGLIDAIERFELGPQPAFRDLRHSAHQGGDHRRVAVDRLGTEVGADEGPCGGAGVHAPRGDAAAHAQRRRGRGRARDERRRLPQGAAQDLLGRHDGARRGAARRRPLRALDAGRDAAGRVVGPGRHLRGQGVQGGTGRGRRRHARAGADRPHDVLLRRPHADGDRPGARRHREQGVPDPHQGAPPAPIEVGRPLRDRRPSTPPARVPGSRVGTVRSGQSHLQLLAS